MLANVTVNGTCIVEDVTPSEIQLYHLWRWLPENVADRAPLGLGLILQWPGTFLTDKASQRPPHRLAAPYSVVVSIEAVPCTNFQLATTSKDLL